MHLSRIIAGVFGALAFGALALTSVAHAAALSQPCNTVNNVQPCIPTDTNNPLPVSGSFTPSGTQDINLKQVNGHTVTEGAGATGNGSQRTTTAQDVTTIAGSAPGTAGAPSANVVSIQGVTSGTVVPVSGTVTTSNPVGITPTDRTITSATGSSQTVMASNASRHSLTIENTGNANCGINPTGGTAVIGGAGTITISPLGSYTPRIPTLSAITAICTSGQPLYADEN